MRRAAGQLLECHIDNWFVHSGEFIADKILIVEGMRTIF